MLESIKVRIVVGINRDGEYCGYAQNDIDDEGLIQEVNWMGPFESVHFVEAEIPLPPTNPTVKGELVTHSIGK